MKEAFEKIKERLEENKKKAHDMHGQPTINDYLLGFEFAMTVALSVVSEVEAKYGNGWIPCSERLPEEEGYYLTTADLFNDEVFDIEELLFENGLWLVDEGFREWEPQGPVLAWMPLPEPYKQKKGA